MSGGVVHLPIREAMRKIIVLCIENKDDPEFVAQVAADKGFEVYSNHAFWRIFTVLTRDAANGKLFPQGPDLERFNEILELSGFTVARQWMHNRFKVSDIEPTAGKGYVQRVLYRPVGSAIEEHFAPKVKQERGRNRVKLSEKQ